MGKKQQRRRRVYQPPTQEDLAAEAAGEAFRFSQMDTLTLILETAIWLWFHGRDPLSIHLLGSAAYRCLNDLSGKVGILRSSVGHQQFTLVYDYLKHAWPNREETLLYRIGANRWLLFEAIGFFEAYFRRISPYMRTFHAYFIIVLVPKPLTSEVLREFLPDNVNVEDVKGLERMAFFQKMAPLFARVARPPV